MNFLNLKFTVALPVVTCIAAIAISSAAAPLRTEVDALNGMLCNQLPCLASRCKTHCGCAKWYDIAVSPVSTITMTWAWQPKRRLQSHVQLPLTPANAFSVPPLAIRFGAPVPAPTKRPSFLHFRPCSSRAVEPDGRQLGFKVLLLAPRLGRS